MEYILSAIVLIIIFCGCLGSWKNKPRNSAKEVIDMLGETHFEKYKKGRKKDE